MFVCVSPNSCDDSLYFSYVVLGVLLPFLMTPEAIDQATAAQVSNRCIAVLDKQVIHQSTLMKLWISLLQYKGSQLPEAN